MFEFRRLKSRSEKHIRMDIKEIGFEGAGGRKLLRAGYSGESLRTE
jgi:hypothetical protein